MNLYEIEVNHCAPKDNLESIACYLIAESDESVYEWMVKQEELQYSDRAVNCYWADKEGNTYPLYDSSYNEIGTETFRERMIRYKGEMNDPDADYSDSYYGVTLYGWKQVSENVPYGTYEQLKDLGIHVFKQG